jgi:HAD superfamily hydrolase (TIGR01509 family)
MRGAYSSKRIFLFDLDGTLVDSSGAHAQAFIEALTPGHPALAREFDYTSFAGRTTREVFLSLGMRDDQELAELIRRKQQLYRTALERGEIPLFAGATALLERLREEGIRLFLVTGASRASTDYVLKATKLLPFFEGITTAEDVPVGKPAPDTYLHTLTTHGLEKSDCLVIEDGESGIASARNAGLEVIAIHSNREIPGSRSVAGFQAFTSLLFP